MTMNIEEDEVIRTMTYDQGQNWGILGQQNLTGVPMNEEIAMSISSWSCGIRIISATIACLPLKYMEHQANGGKTEATNHSLYIVLRYDPNPVMTKEVFWELMISNMLNWGNGYAKIVSKGNSYELWPIHPSHISVFADGESIIYRNSLTNEDITPDKMFHLIGYYSRDGIVGVSPMKYAKETFAVAKAMESFAAALFGNSARPSGFLSSPGTMEEEAYQRLVRAWQSAYTGVRNAGKVPLLEGDVKFNPLTMSPEDLSFIQGRVFSNTEFARLLNLSPVWLHDLSKATWANLVQLTLHLKQQTLQPIMTQIESQIRKKLTFPSDKNKYFATHDVDELLRGDLDSRMKSYATGIQWGVYTSNECRAFEDLVKLPGLDEPLRPLNMITPEQIAEQEKQSQEVIPNDGIQTSDNADSNAEGNGDSGNRRALRNMDGNKKRKARVQRDD